VKLDANATDAEEATDARPTVSDGAGGDVTRAYMDVGGSSSYLTPPYPFDTDGQAEASTPPPPSCLGVGSGIADCPQGDSCCKTSPVSAGVFFLSYDGVSTGYTAQTNQATVSAFNLDDYDVTVGRFRNFVSAAVAGWVPAAGSGKHTHLASGNGLTNSAAATPTYEQGWSTSWNANLPANAPDWDGALQCDATFETWTPSTGSNESLPINCVSWYQAYAFCIWDGGFLPSEAEWNYAASGGSDQRAYPWSTPPNSQTIDCTYANYHGASDGSDFCVMPGLGAINAVGSEKPMGDGKWQQSDLSGNVFQWTLDAYAPYVSQCSDCANLADPASGPRSIRGGAFDNGSDLLLASARNADDPATNNYSIGVRCARP
jgi:formylglycine-generating enzyme required for sulfatase activity